jgi:hypothetical protein
VAVVVTVELVDEDGSRVPVDPETAALLAGPNELYASLVGWTLEGAGALDHGEREKTLEKDSRELQRSLLETTFALDTAREQRVEHLVSEAGIRHGGTETGHDRRVTSIFGPVRVSRLAYRNRREANLYPADARWALAEDTYSFGMRALVAYHVATSGYGQTQEIIAQRTGFTVGLAQITQIAHDLARWVPDFYDQRALGATDLAPGDILAMQGDGKGIALRPEHREERQYPPRGQEDGRDRRRHDLHPRRPDHRGHRRPRRPPRRAPRAHSPGHVGLRVDHRRHPRRHWPGVRRGRLARPPPRPPADLPRRRQPPADHRHRRTREETRPESPDHHRLHPGRRVRPQGRRPAQPRQDRHRDQPVGRRAAPADHTRPRQGRRRHPRVARREAAHPPAHP